MRNNSLCHPMILYATLALAAYDVKWPVASADNGYRDYLAAARAVDSPFWTSLDNRTSDKKDLATLRSEVNHASAVLAYIEKGNSKRAYSPAKPELIYTLHPEYSFFRRVGRLACDAAYIKALDGDPTTASRWLIQADRFARRLPSPSTTALMVKIAIIRSLERTTLNLLPRFHTAQIRSQLNELTSMASHPFDAKIVAMSDLDVTDRSIRQVVDHPEGLGFKDDVPNMGDSIAKVMILSAVSKSLATTLDSIDAAAPPSARSTDETWQKYLIDSEPKVPSTQLTEYRMYRAALRNMAKPGSYKLEDYAKRLNPAERAHAVTVVKTLCDPDLRSVIDSVTRPERNWWTAWAPSSSNRLTDLMMKDGQELSFVRTDMYALQLGDIITKLGVSGDEDMATNLARTCLLDRVNTRLAAVSARIRLFQAEHKRLPQNLHEIGNPKDPITRLPYLYRKTSEKAFELAAVGFPGIGKIDQNTRLHVK